MHDPCERLLEPRNEIVEPVDQRNEAHGLSRAGGRSNPGGTRSHLRDTPGGLQDAASPHHEILRLLRFSLSLGCATGRVASAPVLLSLCLSLPPQLLPLNVEVGLVTARIRRNSRSILNVGVPVQTRRFIDLAEERVLCEEPPQPPVPIIRETVSLVRLV